ncbi:MAG: hypothetical protein WBA29_07950 [Xanthobacteraceae bacterium]
MRSYLPPVIALAMLGLAAPALAADLTYQPDPYESGAVMPTYDQAASIPLQAAVDIANGIGLVSVSNTNMWGNEWQIEGYDVAGSYMEVDVDARTGAVVNVDR